MAEEEEKKFLKENCFLMLLYASCDDNSAQLTTIKRFNSVGNVFACVLAIQRENNLLWGY